MNESIQQAFGKHLPQAPERQWGHMNDKADVVLAFLDLSLQGEESRSSACFLLAAWHWVLQKILVGRGKAIRLGNNRETEEISLRACSGLWILATRSYAHSRP